MLLGNLHTISFGATPDYTLSECNSPSKNTEGCY
jgi:hypothetical protein